MADIKDPEKIQATKDLVLSQVRALWGPEYPNHTFDIITHTYIKTEQYEVITYYAHVIMHKPEGSDWKLLLKSEGCPRLDIALEWLYVKLSERVRKVVERMIEGESWDGLPAYRAE